MTVLCTHRKFLIASVRIRFYLFLVQKNKLSHLQVFYIKSALFEVEFLSWRKKGRTGGGITKIRMGSVGQVRNYYKLQCRKAMISLGRIIYDTQKVHRKRRNNDKKRDSSGLRIDLKCVRPRVRWRIADLAREMWNRTIIQGWRDRISFGPSTFPAFFVGERAHHDVLVLHGALHKRRKKDGAMARWTRATHTAKEVEKQARTDNGLAPTSP